MFFVNKTAKCGWVNLALSSATGGNFKRLLQYRELMVNVGEAVLQMCGYLEVEQTASV